MSDSSDRATQMEVRTAAARWNAAMRSMRSFPERLTEVRDAAIDQKRAHLKAELGGLAWRPITTSQRIVPPHELTAGQRPEAPRALWARFDRALDDLAKQLQRDDHVTLAAAYSALADVLDDLLDVVDVIHVDDQPSDETVSADERAIG